MQSSGSLSKRWVIESALRQAHDNGPSRNEAFHCTKLAKMIESVDGNNNATFQIVEVMQRYNLDGHALSKLYLKLCEDLCEDNIIDRGSLTNDQHEFILSLALEVFRVRVPE